MATTSAPGKFAATIKNILLAAILIVVSAGTTLFVQDRFLSNGVIVAEPEARREAAPVNIPEPLFTSLEPFTVTLPDEYTSRVLYVGITLRVEDEASRKMLNVYMPEVRDRILATLTNQTAMEVQAPGGRERLSEAIQETISRPYHPNPEGPRVSRVLFTAFVVQ